MVGVVASGWLTVAKVWRTSPRGIEPVVKVSVLDLLQARSLAGTARRAAAEGKHDESLQAWGGALGNNLADVRLWRELLEQLATDSPDSNHLHQAGPFLGQLNWFCSLTRTNTDDVVLAARVCEQHEAFEQLLVLPLPGSPEEIPSLTALRLKALFRVGRMYEFTPLFERNRERVEEQRGFDLYRLAYLAGWGELKDRAAWQEKLESDAAASGQERLARKLGIIVANQTGDAGTAARLVQELETAGEASIMDHALLWMTLIGADLKAAALADLAGSRLVPRNATDLNLIAGACTQLGLTNQCAQLLARTAPALGRNRTAESANVWMVWAALTIERRDWAGLRDIADAMRRVPGPHDWLDGYADFLEGYGAQQMAEGPLAENRLRRAAKADYPVGNLGVAAANGLSSLDHPDWAEAILRPLADRFRHNPVYWRAVWSVTLRQHQDQDRLMEAATRLYELEPNQRIARFNYAAALLVRRERPAEALRILFDLRQTMTPNLYNELNYSLALVRNGRFDEAREILAPINAAALTDAERPSYHLCQMELFLATGDTNRAAAAIKNIDPGGFFPCQSQWLEETTAALNLGE